jgi:hypothetical protein
VVPDEVALADTALVEILHRVLDRVLGALLRARERRVAAGNDPLHHLGIRPVRGWHLGGVEHAEPSGCARSDVEQPPPAAERRLGCLDGTRNRFPLAMHGLRNALILGGNQVHDLQRRGKVDIRGARIALLRDPWIAGSRLLACLSGHGRLPAFRPGLFCRGRGTSS